MKISPKIQSVIRLLIVCLVMFVPADVSIETRFLLSGIFSALWAIEPLARSWQCDNPARKAVACVVAAAVLLAPLNVHSQERPPPQDDPEAVTLLEAGLAVAIVAIIGYGYYRYYVKAKTTTTKIGKKKAKQIEETNPWPDDPESVTNIIASKISGTPQEYGAWYFEPTGDAAECDGPMPVIEWVTPEQGQTSARFYFPTDPIALSDFLKHHGLSESPTANFSRNRLPSDAPPIFSYTNRTLTFAIPGTVNRTSILQRSPDLAKWETIFTTASPARMVNNFADGTLADAGRQFYRVLVLP